MICSVKKLSYANPSSSPIACGKGMLESFGDNPWPHCGRDRNDGSFHSDSFKLILYVPSQISECNSEQVCKQRSCQSQAFVLEVIFVVSLSSSQ
jgi:hypothetical protein